MTGRRVWREANARMPDALSLPSPAKLNLFLRVIGRRADGLHELQTLFQLLDYGDSLRLSLCHSGIRLHCYGVPAPKEDDNLVCRAARLLAETCQVRAGADIELYKRVPLGSGLGGGSSNAASALHGLNRLWQCGLTVSELADLGVRLGADVAVFVHGRSAWGEGIGDQLCPMALPPHWYLVLAPPLAVSTRQLYARLRLTNYSLPITIDDYRLGGAGNVFEPLVMEQYPEVRRLRDWLSSYAPTRMSGTGGAVFAAFADWQTAQSVFVNRPDKTEGFLCRGVASSPLLENGN